jgi:hypothetical protein
LVTLSIKEKENTTNVEKVKDVDRGRKCPTGVRVPCGGTRTLSKPPALAVGYFTIPIQAENAQKLEKK